MKSGKLVVPESEFWVPILISWQQALLLSVDFHINHPEDTL
jgi:hypothetical protein